MTAADHANTVRDALRCSVHGNDYDQWCVECAPKRDAAPSLDTLKAQAEKNGAKLSAAVDAQIAWETQRRQTAEAEAKEAWEFEHKMMERATEAEEKLEAAEAERDRLKVDNEALVLERDGADSERIRYTDLYDKTVAERDRLTLALKDARRSLALEMYAGSRSKTAKIIEDALADDTA